MNRQTQLKILLDSNVLIAAYPKTWGGVELTTQDANELLSLANEHGHTTYHHPASMEIDFGENITDAEYREWRKTVTRNHPELPAPPSTRPEIEKRFGGNPKDRADNWILSAVKGEAVHILVTEDKGILTKARELELGERVVNIEDAIATLKAPLPNPTGLELVPEMTVAYILDETDPIFDSLREDYRPHFDSWLSKCKREHRDCWVVWDKGGALIAVTIVKEEDPPDFGSGGKTLKVCLFKVSDDHPSMSYGELLLGSVFDYCYKNEYESAYVTAFPKYARVAEFFEQFGFLRNESRATKLGEWVFEKRLIPPSSGGAGVPDGLDYHIQYGPRYYSLEAQRFIVPIKPEFQKILLPEVGAQLGFNLPQMLTRSGNALRKAYLTQRRIRNIKPGAILYFYRSHSERGLVAVGVVESVEAHSDPTMIEAYVGGRTVYSREQIEEMTSNGEREVLTILFRQSRILRSEKLTDAKLREASVWKRPFQTMTMIQTRGAEWLKRHVDLAQ